VIVLKHSLKRTTLNEITVIMCCICELQLASYQADRIEVNKNAGELLFIVHCVLAQFYTTFTTGCILPIVVNRLLLLLLQ